VIDLGWNPQIYIQNISPLAFEPSIWASGLSLHEQRNENAENRKLIWVWERWSERKIDKMVNITDKIKESNSPPSMSKYVLNDFQDRRGDEEDAKWARSSPFALTA
jgi:hypothetical protein